MFSVCTDCQLRIILSIVAEPTAAPLTKNRRTSTEADSPPPSPPNPPEPLTMDEERKMAELQKNSAAAGPQSDGVKNNYTKRTLSELAADNALVWLIEVGLLRREVDGQGITDSFRLTPLGRQLTESFQSKTWATPTITDRLLNVLTRIFRLPF